MKSEPSKQANQKQNVSPGESVPKADIGPVLDFFFRELCERRRELQEIHRKDRAAYADQVFIAFRRQPEKNI